MADHAKINLRDEAEDQAPKFSTPDGIEARFARKAMGDSSQSGVSYFAYGPDFKTAFGHTHSEQEETYVVVAGAGTVRVGDEDVAVRTWDAVRIPPGAAARDRGRSRRHGDHRLRRRPLGRRRDDQRLLVGRSRARSVKYRATGMNVAPASEPAAKRASRATVHGCGGSGAAARAPSGDGPGAGLRPGDRHRVAVPARVPPLGRDVHACGRREARALDPRAVLVLGREEHPRVRSARASGWVRRSGPATSATPPGRTTR